MPIDGVCAPCNAELLFLSACVCVWGGGGGGGFQLCVDTSVLVCAAQCLYVGTMYVL